MSSAILTLNVGSSSVKARLFDAGQVNHSSEAIGVAHISGIGGEAAALHFEGPPEQRISKTLPKTDRSEALALALKLFEGAFKSMEIICASHRVVHGGQKFSEPVILDDAALSEIESLAPLAPGHQPFNVAGVHAVSKKLPGIPQIASFDTAFHRTQSAIAQQYALPREIRDTGVIRYGFHGLSYAYIASVAGDVLGRRPGRKLIVAHLGSGASMCAIEDGRSVATTMGFTALDGLPMSTRCGDLDPGAVLHLIGERRMPIAELSTILNQQSGLLGLSGVSGDMRDLLRSDNPAASQAIDYFILRCVQQIGSLAAAMEGLDALIFTAGIGENSPEIRERIVNKLSWLGVELDQEANQTGKPHISTPLSRLSAWVIPTNEELMLAINAFSLLQQ
ncbi:MAG: acetate/propionate family kinase [Pseudomonadota bacterium]